MAIPPSSRRTARSKHRRSLRVFVALVGGAFLLVTVLVPSYLHHLTGDQRGIPDSATHNAKDAVAAAGGASLEAVHHSMFDTQADAAENNREAAPAVQKAVDKEALAARAEQYQAELAKVAGVRKCLTVTQFLRQAPYLRVFSAALDKSGLADILNDASLNVTLLVPMEFESSFRWGPAFGDDDWTLLAQLQYHIIPQGLGIEQLGDSGYARTLLGPWLRWHTDPSAPPVSVVPFQGQDGRELLPFPWSGKVARHDPPKGSRAAQLAADGLTAYSKMKWRARAHWEQYHAQYAKPLFFSNADSSDVSNKKGVDIQACQARIHVIARPLEPPERFRPLALQEAATQLRAPADRNYSHYKICPGVPRGSSLAWSDNDSDGKRCLTVRDHYLYDGPTLQKLNTQQEHYRPTYAQLAGTPKQSWLQKFFGSLFHKSNRQPAIRLPDPKKKNAAGESAVGWTPTPAGAEWWQLRSAELEFQLLSQEPPAPHLAALEEVQQRMAQQELAQNLTANGTDGGAPLAFAESGLDGHYVSRNMSSRRPQQTLVQMMEARVAEVLKAAAAKAGVPVPPELKGMDGKQSKGYRDPYAVRAPLQTLATALQVDLEQLNCDVTAASLNGKAWEKIPLPPAPPRAAPASAATGKERRSMAQQIQKQLRVRWEVNQGVLAVLKAVQQFGGIPAQPEVVTCSMRDPSWSVQTAPAAGRMALRAVRAREVFPTGAGSSLLDEFPEASDAMLKAAFYNVDVAKLVADVVAAAEKQAPLSTVVVSRQLNDAPPAPPVPRKALVLSNVAALLLRTAVRHRLQGRWDLSQIEHTRVMQSLVGGPDPNPQPLSASPAYTALQENSWSKGWAKDYPGLPELLHEAAREHKPDEWTRMLDYADREFASYDFEGNPMPGLCICTSRQIMGPLKKHAAALGVDLKRLVKQVDRALPLSYAVDPCAFAPGVV